MSNRPTTTTETTWRKKRRRGRRRRRTRMGDPGKSYYTRRDIQTAATTPKVCCSCSCCCTRCRCCCCSMLLFHSLLRPSLPLLSSLFAFDFQCAIKMRPGQKRQRQFRIEGERQLNLDPVPATTGFYCLPLILLPCPALCPPPSLHSAPPPPFVGFNKRIAAHSQHIQKMRQNNEKCLKIAMLLQCFPCPPASVSSLALPSYCTA